MRSKYSTVSTFVRCHLGPLLIACVGAAGCAHAASGPYIDHVPIRLNELDAATLSDVGAGRAVVIEVQAGDRIPVELIVDGEVISTDPGAATFMLKAKRAFFLRIAGTELKTSLDGKSFDAKPAAPGAFRIGLVKTTDKSALVSVHITTPVHARR